jgi:hypothetical protein
MDHDIPINVIILDDVERETENLINCYYEILKTCKKQSEVKAALKLFCSEQRELTLREILIRDIQMKAKLLDDTKNNR